MSDLNKKHVSTSELKKLISEAIGGKERLKQVDWRIIRMEKPDRGENFDIKITGEQSEIPEAISEIQDIFAKIKGLYWLE